MKRRREEFYASVDLQIGRVIRAVSLHWRGQMDAHDGGGQQIGGLEHEGSFQRFAVSRCLFAMYSPEATMTAMPTIDQPSGKSPNTNQPSSMTHTSCE